MFGGPHGVRCLSMLLRMTSNLRVHAVRATFFFRFTSGTQAVVEGFDYWIVSGGYQGSHV